MPARPSYGVILIRKNKETSHYECLLVNKRCTFAFSDFVQGKYTLPIDLDEIGGLINNMTVEEIFIILSMDFSAMWSRVWSGNTLDMDKVNWEFYMRKLKKFNRAFSGRNGERLREKLLNAKTRNRPLWEFPKGKQALGETTLECAIRELKEETGIEIEDINIIPNAYRRISYVDNGCSYTSVYNIAFYNKECCDGQFAKISDALIDKEILCTQWYTLNEVRLLFKGDKQMIELLEPAISVAKKYVAGKWDPFIKR